MSGRPSEGGCSCHIAPPCSYCENGVWVVVSDDLFRTATGGWTTIFDEAEHFGYEEEAMALAKVENGDRVERWERT